MKMTTRVAYCNMRHYKSKNILIGIAIILTTLLLFVIYHHSGSNQHYELD